MARWRAAAIERMPDLKSLVESSKTISELWVGLCDEFAIAYDKPMNEDVIAQIYAFADWCVEAPRCDEDGRDPFSAVVVGFYESIPTLPNARDDMPRWFKYSAVKDNRLVFSYLIGDEAFEKLLEHMKQNQKKYHSKR